MPRLSDLEPRRKDLVIDLVRKAGLDVSDWANSKRGEAGASMNPKYCYEWAFVQPERGVVLNLWHDDMDESGGQIVKVGNFRVDPNSGGSSKPTWDKRRRRLDEALQMAAKRACPVGVIINAGIRRTGDPNAKPAQVKFRELDPVPWTLTYYDWASGAHKLTRGWVNTGFVDQFSLTFDDPAAPARVDRTGTIFVRDPAVRHSALARANGRCEFCDAEGFRTRDGRIYLETHHIIPLSEGGLDSPQNVRALCPNHHREAHHGDGKEELRRRLLATPRTEGSGSPVPD